METIMKYLKQPSTWRGLIAILAGFGVTMSPEQVEAIVVAAVAALGVVEAFRNEDATK